MFTVFNSPATAMLPPLLVFSLFVQQNDSIQRITNNSYSPETIGEYVVALASVIENKAFYKELDIVEDQAKQIRSRLNKVNQKHHDEMESAYDRFMKTKDKEEYRRLVKTSSESYAKQITRLFDDVLLPHQVKKLDRIVYWSIIKSYRNSRLNGNEASQFRSRFQDDTIKSLLKISSKQSQTINKKVNSLQNEFHAELAKLQDKYDKLIAKELGSEQQQLDKKKLGKTPGFIFRRSD